jgi:hypothetical protein
LSTFGGVFGGDGGGGGCAALTFLGAAAGAGEGDKARKDFANIVRSLLFKKPLLYLRPRQNPFPNFCPTGGVKSFQRLAGIFNLAGCA